MDNNKEYYAFISYKREDEKWAKWLQHRLEHYRFPTNLNGRTDLPKNIRPTFRDMTDLTPGVLAEEINAALRNSQWLIVVCSPRSAKSPWVCKEAQTFIDLGRADHIIPFIIEGTPFSNDLDTECYPEALLNLTGSKELLAANINEMGRDAAVIKVVARMFGLKFDNLWRRHEREQRRKRWLIVAGSILFALISLFVGVRFARMNAKLKAVNKEVRAEKERADAERDRAEKATDSLKIVNKEVLEERDRANAERDRAEEATNSLRTAYDSITRQKDLIQQQNAQLAEERDNVLKANWRMMENRARFVAAKGQELIDNHDSYTARLLALAILPDSLENPNRPYVVEAERLLRNATIFDEGVLSVHNGRVCFAAFSFDSKRILSAFMDSTIRVWDVKTGLQLAKLSFSNSVKSIIFSPDSVHMACVLDESILIYNVETMSCIQTLRGHSSLVKSVRYNYDGSLIVSSSEDNTIRIWDVNTGKCKKIFDHKMFHDTDFPYTDAFFCPTSKKIFALYDYSIDVGNVESGKAESTLEPPIRNSFGFYTSADISPNGNTLVVASDETGSIKRDGNRYSIFIIDITTGDVIKKIGEHYGKVNSVKYSSSGRYVVSASDDKKIKVWDVESCLCVFTFNGHENPVLYAEFSQDEEHILSVSYDNTVRIWSLKHSYEETDNCFMVDYSYDNKYFATASLHRIKVWDISKGILISVIDAMADSHYYFEHFRFNPKRDELATLCSDDSVRIWNYHTGKCVNSFGWMFGQGSFDFSTTGDSIICSLGDRIGLFDISKNNYIKESNIILEHVSEHNIIYHVAICPDNRHAISSSSGNIHVWNLLTGHCIKVIQGDVSNVASLSYSHNGEYILALYYDGTTKIWDTSGKCVRVIKEEEYSGLKFAIFSPNDEYVLTSSGKYVHIYDFMCGICVQTIPIYGNNGCYAIFSPNGKTILSLMNSGVCIWDFPPLQDLIDETRKRFKDRQLTPEERRMYYLE